LRRNNFNPNRRRNFDNKVEGLTVEVRNGDVNAALRRFKKKIAEDGILQEYKERQHYVKPSEKRKKAKAAGRARWLKKLRKRQQDLGY